LEDKSNERVMIVLIFRCVAGNAEPYIVLALLIGFVTVVIGCWLSDNCWSPEPEHIVTIA